MLAPTPFLTESIVPFCWFRKTYSEKPTRPPVGLFENIGNNTPLRIIGHRLQCVTHRQLRIPRLRYWMGARVVETMTQRRRLPSTLRERGQTVRGPTPQALISAPLSRGRTPARGCPNSTGWAAKYYLEAFGIDKRGWTTATKRRGVVLRGAEKYMRSWHTKED